MLLDDKKILTREKRTDAITAYLGTNEFLQAELVKNEVRQRIRTFSQDKKDELYEALRLLSTIDGAVIIVHGVIGTDIVEQAFISRRNELVWYSTNLNERDTILGSDQKLRDTIYAAYRTHHPKVIFIVSTSVVAINNDDIVSVIIELEEELPLKIISIYTDGFKTRTEINGIDIVNHSLGRYVLKKPQKKTEQISLVSISESKKNLAEIKRILENIGIKYQIVPQFSSIEELQSSAEARAAIAIDYDEADIFLESLHEKGNVEIIEADIPIGLENTAKWISALAEKFNLASKAEAFIAEQEQQLKAIAWQRLKGKKVFVALPTAQAIAIASFLEEMGLIIVGISIPYIDNLNKQDLTLLDDDLLIVIGAGQPFELANILSRERPDFYIGTAGLTAWTAALGIVPISVENLTLYGYQGVRELFEKIDAADQSRGFVEYIQKTSALPYKKTWLQKSPGWYIKVEVK